MFDPGFDHVLSKSGKVAGPPPPVSMKVLTRPPQTRGGALRHPEELYEAASIDGASGPQKLRHVTLPQLKPVVVSIALLDFIWTMQVFPLVWMTTAGGPIHATEMLSTYTYKLAFSKFDFSLASASAVILFILSMSMTYFYIKHQRSTR